jgi:hypothetical protein
VQADQGNGLPVGAGCGVGTPFNGATNRTYEPGNFVVATGANGCTGSGWSARSVMQASDARTLRSLTEVATDPAGKSGSVATNGATVNTLTAFSSIAYYDQMTIGAGGVIPAAVTFELFLSGSVGSALTANAAVRHTADVGMAWDTNLSPTLQQNVVRSGLLTFTFAVTPDMVGRAIGFSTRLWTFATLIAVDPTQPMIGSAVTDYANTATITRLSFRDASGADVTGGVNYTTASGTDYVTPLAVVPEPSSLALAGAGLLALGAGARVRRRAGGTPAPR